jgi:hypothetical protein
MISGMTGMDETKQSAANQLCRSCGLCCSGHLFLWTKLRATELDSAEALGLKVLRSVPSQRGFNQPCPLWNGQCTVYDSPYYPHFCRVYKCKLLKKLLDGTTALPDALAIIGTTRGMIQEMEELLRDPSIPNFRERLVAELEGILAGEEHPDPEFVRKTDALLALYEEVFGVTDVVDRLAEE